MIDTAKMTDTVKYKSVIEALNECAIACDHCYNTSFQEQAIRMMERCIKLQRDCAEICRLTSSALARDSEVAPALLQACAKICKACSDVCSKHEAHRCQDCTSACRRCEEACRSLLAKNSSSRLVKA